MQDADTGWVVSTRTPADGSLAVALQLSGRAASACQAVADHLVAVGYPLPSLYLAQHGRLRCYGIAGYRRAFDGIEPGVGVIGRTYLTGEPVVVRSVVDDEAYVALVDGVTQEACVPVRRADGVVIGVVNVEDRVPLPQDAVQVLSAAADLLGRRLEVLFRPDDVSPLRRLAHHAVLMAEATDHQQAVARTADAARSVAGTSSAMLALLAPGQDGEHWHVAAATGELAQAQALAGMGERDLDRLGGWIPQACPSTPCDRSTRSRRWATSLS